MAGMGIEMKVFWLSILFAVKFGICFKVLRFDSLSQFGDEIPLIQILPKCIIKQTVTWRKHVLSHLGPFVRKNFTQETLSRLKIARRSRFGKGLTLATTGKLMPLHGGLLNIAEYSKRNGIFASTSRFKRGKHFDAPFRQLLISVDQNCFRTNTIKVFAWVSFRRCSFTALFICGDDDGTFFLARTQMALTKLVWRQMALKEEKNKRRLLWRSKRANTGKPASPNTGCRFTFDNYPSLRIPLLFLIILLQFSVPIAHLYVRKWKKMLRLLSIQAFITFLSWLTFYVACAVADCYRFGKLVHDVTIFCNLMMAMSYIVMIGECCVSAEFILLTNLNEDMPITEYIELQRQAKPERVIFVECYNDGRLRQQVSTYKENRVFPTEYWTEHSEVLTIEPGIVEVHFHVEINCGNEDTKRKFQEMKNEMLSANQNKGEIVEVSHRDYIPGLEMSVCGHTHKREKPFWISPWLYLVASIFCLSWPYR